jgi:L-fuconolactonase
MTGPRIDAHQHFWRLADRPGQWPPPSLAAIHRDFGPEALHPLLDAAGLDASVLVQTLESETETGWMLRLAADDPRIAAVVGWTALDAPGAPDAIGRLAAHAKLRGLRPMLQDQADVGWIASPALHPAIAAMARHGLVFDALVRPRHLDTLLRLAERHPSLRIVVDHGAKPEIAAGRMEPWRGAMARLAALPNVACKLSGLLTEADGDAEAVRPFAEALLTLFGPERLMFGSDWPVLLLAGDYAAWAATCRAWVPAAWHGAVFGATAARVYGI